MATRLPFGIAGTVIAGLLSAQATHAQPPSLLAPPAREVSVCSRDIVSETATGADVFEPLGCRVTNADAVARLQSLAGTEACADPHVTGKGRPICRLVFMGPTDPLAAVAVWQDGTFNVAPAHLEGGRLRPGSADGAGELRGCGQSAELARAALDLMAQQVPEDAILGVKMVRDFRRFRILHMAVGSAADRAGLLPYDHVLSIDGKSTARMSLGQATELLKGTRGTEVVLKIERPPEYRPRTVVVTRSFLDRANVRWKNVPEPVELNVAETQARFVGVWTGKWDDTWPIQFIITVDEEEPFHLVYQHKDDVGGLWNGEQGRADIRNGKCYWGRLIEIAVDPQDADTALATGAFPDGEKTAQLRRLHPE